MPDELAGEKTVIKAPEKPSDPKPPEMPQVGPKEAGMLNSLIDKSDPDKNLQALREQKPEDSGSKKLTKGDTLRVESGARGSGVIEEGWVLEGFNPDTGDAIVAKGQGEQISRRQINPDDLRALNQPKQESGGGDQAISADKPPSEQPITEPKQPEVQPENAESAAKGKLEEETQQEGIALRENVQSVMNGIDALPEKVSLNERIQTRIDAMKDKYFDINAKIATIITGAGAISATGIFGLGAYEMHKEVAKFSDYAEWASNLWC